MPTDPITLNGAASQQPADHVAAGEQRPLRLVLGDDQVGDRRAQPGGHGAGVDAVDDLDVHGLDAEQLADPEERHGDGGARR